MCSGRGDGQLRPPGFPIRTPSDHSPVAGSPRIIAGSNVLHRLLVPRHPPCALINLTLGTTCKILQKTEDARVHYAVLKIRTEPCHKTPQQEGLASRPYESAPWKSGCLLRTQQCAHPARRSARSFRPVAEAGDVLTAASRASRMNSQCSTRKHGRP